MIEEIESKSDCRTNSRDLFNEEGVMNVAKHSCINKNKKEIKKNKLATFILLSPIDQRAISSFCFSNFIIDRAKANRKDRGINLVIMFVMFKNEKKR